MARTIELTEEQLDAKIAAASRAGAEAAIAAMQATLRTQPQQPQPVIDATPDQQFQAMIDERKGRNLPAIPQEVVACKSNTMATFNAVIVRGKVIRLDDYVFPPGHDKYVGDGGLVPERAPMLDSHGQKEMAYKQWLWETFWQADLKAFVGKPLPNWARAPEAAE